jgi:tyrosinase
VQDILSIPDYEAFFLAVENGPHNIAPLGIKGDFDSFTAPYGNFS